MNRNRKMPNTQIFFLYQYLNTSWGLRSKASKRVHEDERLEYTISPLRVH